MIFLNEDFMRHLLYNLGGEDYGRPPLRAIFLGKSVGSHYHHRPEVMWVSRDAGKLLSWALDRIANEHKTTAYGPPEDPIFWPREVSPNALKLVLRRLTRTIQKADESTEPEIEAEQASA